MFFDFFGYFGKHLFEVKTAVVTFWAKFEQIGLLFIPTTGHAVREGIAMAGKSEF